MVRKFRENGRKGEDARKALKPAIATIAERSVAPILLESGIIRRRASDVDHVDGSER